MAYARLVEHGGGVMLPTFKNVSPLLSAAMDLHTSTTSYGLKLATYHLQGIAA